MVRALCRGLQSAPTGGVLNHTHALALWEGPRTPAAMNDAAAAASGSFHYAAGARGTARLLALGAVTSASPMDLCAGLALYHLPAPLCLRPGVSYFLTSTERAGCGDAWNDVSCDAAASGGVGGGSAAPPAPAPVPQSSLSAASLAAARRRSVGGAQIAVLGTCWQEASSWAQDWEETGGAEGLGSTLRSVGTALCMPTHIEPLPAAAAAAAAAAGVVGDAGCPSYNVVLLVEEEGGEGEEEKSGGISAASDGSKSSSGGTLSPAAGASAGGSSGGSGGGAALSPSSSPSSPPPQDSSLPPRYAHVLQLFRSAPFALSVQADSSSSRDTLIPMSISSSPPVQGLCVEEGRYAAQLEARAAAAAWAAAAQQQAAAAAAAAAEAEAEAASAAAAASAPRTLAEAREWLLNEDLGAATPEAAAAQALALAGARAQAQADFSSALAAARAAAGTRAPPAQRSPARTPPSQPTPWTQSQRCLQRGVGGRGRRRRLLPLGLPWAPCAPFTLQLQHPSTPAWPPASSPAQVQVIIHWQRRMRAAGWGQP